MDDKKKIFLSVIGGVAVIFYLITNFCIPTAKENKDLFSKYRALKQEVDAFNQFSKEKLETLNKNLDQAIGAIEEKMPSADKKVRLIEYMTNVPEGANIKFVTIQQNPSRQEQGYEVSSVNITMQSSFGDLLKYLNSMVDSKILINIKDLNISSFDPKTDVLNIDIVFEGYKTNLQLPSTSSYFDKRYEPIDLIRLDRLTKSVKIENEEVYAGLGKDYSPFIDKYIDLVQDDENEQEVVVDLGDNFDINKYFLKGTTSIGKQKAALINQSILTTGQYIDDLKVVNISDYEVSLERKGKKYRLKIGADEGIKHKE